MNGRSSHMFKLFGEDSIKILLQKQGTHADKAVSWKKLKSHCTRRQLFRASLINIDFTKNFGEYIASVQEHAKDEFIVILTISMAS